MNRSHFFGSPLLIAICLAIGLAGCEPISESGRAPVKQPPEKQESEKKEPETNEAEKKQPEEKAGVDAVQKAAGDADVDEGERLYDERMFEEAIPHYEVALTKPLSKYKKSEVLNMIGNCYNKIDQYPKALEYVERALKEDPDNHIAHVNKGGTLRLLGQFDRASESYAKALELKPDDASVYIGMGSLAVHQEAYDVAIKHLERAIELDDSQPVAHSNLAVAYAYANRLDEAEEQLEKATELGYHQPGLVRQLINERRKNSEK